MHWALAGEVPSVPRVVVPPDDHRAGRRRAGRVQRGATCRSPRPADAAASAARRCRCSVEWCSTSPRWQASSASTRSPASSRCWPARSGPTSSASSTSSTASPSATSRRASTSRRSADGSRVAAPASTAPATARSSRWSPALEVVLADGTRRAHRRRSCVGVRARPRPAVPRQRGHARHHHPGLAAHPSRARRSSTWRRTRCCRSRTASRRAGGSSAAARHRPCCACTTPSRASAVRAATARRACCSCSTRATQHSSTRRCGSSPRSSREVDADRLGSEPGRELARAPQRHERAAGADPQGLRRRHAGDRRAVEPAADDLRRRAAPRCSPCRMHAPPRATCRTATATVHASTSRSPPLRRRTRSSRRTSRCGTPASAPCSQPAATSRTTTVSASTAAASWPRRSGRRSTVLPSVKDALDPNGILNPGKLGLPSPFGEVGVAVSRFDRPARCAPAAARVPRVRRAVRGRRAMGRRQRDDGGARDDVQPRRAASASCSVPASPRGCSSATTRSPTALVTALGTYVADAGRC